MRSSQAAELPATPCAAYVNNPQEGKVYVLPKFGEPGHQAHCNVTGIAIAVHDGDFRSLYGTEVYPASGPNNATIIEDIIGGVVERLRRQAKANFDKDSEAKTRCASGGACAVSLKILVFAHGGLVSQASGMDEAETMAPGMMADGYSPLFLLWNSDFFGAYGERLCCVLEGEQSKRLLPYFLPSRLAGDVLSSIARAPEYFGQQVLRFNDSVLAQSGTQYYLASGDRAALCDAALSRLDCPRLIYPPFEGKGDGDRELNAQDQPVVEQGLGYRLAAPARWFTTETITQLGAQAWDDMVRRTRLALQAPIIEVSGQTVGAAGASDCGLRTKAQIDRLTAAVAGARADPSAVRFTPTAEGGISMLFDRLDCEIAENGLDFAAPDQPRNVSVKTEIYYYGHSMGAIVGDELLLSHPNLPWKRVVYMAAAASTRDIRSSVAPLLACGSRTSSRACPTGDGGLRFYNLMLHPLAESHDLEAYGIVPEGSLLEWIDEMFGGPKSVDDRMFGKWTNVEKTLTMFPPEVRQRMSFRVFPAQAAMRTGTPDEQAAYAAECTAGPSDDTPAARCHPITHGDFTNYAFWRDDFLCGAQQVESCLADEKGGALHD